MQHILISSLLILILVVADLVPLLKKKDREKQSVWFAISAYSLALVINVLVGLEVKIAVVAKSIMGFIHSFMNIG